MVNNQQYDSHVAECFIVDRSTPCLRGVGVKAWSGKEDTTLLSMADCRVKQSTVSTATRYGIKPRIQGCPRGSVRIGGQRIRFYKTKQNKIVPQSIVRTPYVHTYTRGLGGYMYETYYHWENWLLTNYGAS